jgi:hypothetical protein
VANSGWSGKTDQRWDCTGEFGEDRPANPGFDIKGLIVPSTVGVQRANKGWSPLEMPVDNDNDSPGDLKEWGLPTGAPGGGYNTAVQEPPGM